VAVRYSLEWLGSDPLLRLVEPTLAEVRAHAATLAGYYNEPTNRALLTNEQDFEAVDVVDQFKGMWKAHDRPFLLFAGGDMIGDCDLRHVEADRAEFAILIGPRATQARGLGTRFSTMLVELAFRRLGLLHVYAAIRPENGGSLRMFEKLGFDVDTTPAGRRYAEEDDDVCVSIEKEKFLRLRGDRREVKITERQEASGTRRR
jgi:RimJ/RimL family protein N-acetyltransferase